MRHRLRDAAGQATLEYLAVVALVTAAVAAAGAIAEGPALARHVTRAMARAVCVAAGGECRHDREPCVVGSHARRRGSHANLLVVRLGGSREVVVEQRSDGTVAVTAMYEDEQGVELGLGAGADVLGVGVGAALTASLVAAQRAGRTWIAGSAHEAARLVERLREHERRRVRRRRADPRAAPPAPLPPVAVTTEEREVALTLAAQVGAAAVVELGSAAGGLDTASVRGVRVDRRTGRRTLYLRDVRGRLGRLGLGGRGRVLGISDEEQAIVAVDVDRAGRPVALSVQAVAPYRGSRDLPEVAQPAAGLLAVLPGSGRAVVSDLRLELTSAESRALAAGVVAQLTGRAGPGSGAPSDELVRRLADAAAVEVRVVAQEESDGGWGVHFATGLKVGAGRDASERSTRLLAAASRGPGGQWLRREDCL